MANIIRVGGGAGGSSKVKKMAISNLTEGTIVRIKEKGVEQDYYLAQHNYQSGLNGAGRVLFVRKNCYDNRAWDSGNVNAYATSDIDTWLNGEVKSWFDADVREAMGETQFPYTIGGGSKVLTNLSRSVFLVSAAEIGATAPSYYNTEGALLPIASRLVSATLADGTPATYWTRTPEFTGAYSVIYIDSTVSAIHGGSGANTQRGSRPCFTLHESCTVLEEVNSDGSYTLSLGDDVPDDKQVFKLTVVDGTAKPANPVENTLWVNTDVDMGLLYLAPNAPASPEVGDVWVNTTNKYNLNGTNASTKLIRVNDNPYLEINVMQICQWNGSAWVNREGSAIYANGAWTNMALWLFNYGMQNADYPLKVGYSKSSQNIDSALGSLIYNGETASYNIAYGSSGCAMIMTTKPVNLGNYNKLSIACQQTQDVSVRIGFLASSNPTLTPNAFNISLYYSGISLSKKEMEFDISSYSGEMYPGVTSGAPNNYGNTFSIYYWCFTA